MKKALTLLLAFTIAFYANSQDTHFSQMSTTPLHLNPALTGVMEKSHRLNFKYREQWGSVLNNNKYKSLFFSYDNQICLPGSGEFFSYGVSALADEAGQHQFTTLLANISLAYHRKISKNASLGLGGQAGFFSYTIGDKAFKFDEQFGPNGFDSEAESFEDFQKYTTGPMFDLSIGGYYYNAAYNLEIGIAAYHVNEPAFSFLGTSPINDPRVNTRFVLHSSFQLLGNRAKSFIDGQALLMVQKFVPNILYWQFVPGVKWTRKYRRRGRSLSFGLSGRITKHAPKKSILLDAAILSTEINYESMIIGLTYEVNLSTLKKASRLQGGPEISMVFFLNSEPSCVHCPENF